MMQPGTFNDRLTTLVQRAREHRIRLLGGAATALLLVGVLALPTVDSGPGDTVAARGPGDEKQDPAAADDDVADPAPDEAQTDDSSGETSDASDGSTEPPAAGGATPSTEPTGGQPTGGSGSPDVETGNTRGVGDDLVRIGVTIPDLSSVGHISDTYDLGDPEEQMESILDGWRREGSLPVHGRDVEFVYRTYDIFSAEAKIAACKELIQDEKVFSVIGGQFFAEGAECVTERFDTPLVTQNGTTVDVYERADPYYFTLKPAYADLFRNFIAWADRNGHLADKTIGLYYQQDAASDVETGIKQELERRGYTIEEELVSEGAGTGSAQDQVAVQRFRQAGVDLVIPAVGGSNVGNFTQLAQSQGYHPDYIDTDFETHTNDTTTELYQPNQWDGVLAMTTGRVGEVAAGMTLPAPATSCVANYERYSGKQVGHESPENAEYENLLMSCDLAEVTLAGIQGAGRPLGHRTMIQGLDGIRGKRMARHGDLSYAPGQHWGTRNQRTIQWSRDCGCWNAHGKFRPFDT